MERGIWGEGYVMMGINLTNVIHRRRQCCAYNDDTLLHLYSRQYCFSFMFSYKRDSEEEESGAEKLGEEK